jgi:pimeloyl-ACP methyl ester carboxylesterase
MIKFGFLVVAAVLAASAAHAQSQAPSTTTRDIAFTSHDGHVMLGRLTLPTTPGLHPVLVFVQNAEASTLDQRTRNAKGVVVPFFDLYRETLAPLGVGFFSYEGRGVHSDATQPRGMRMDAAVYNTSTLENKVRDVITAVDVLKTQPGVDSAKIMLRGVSEGTLLAAEAATRMPDIRALVLSGVLGSTLKDALKFMVAGGTYLQHLGHWDADNDGRISAKEYEDDAKGVRRKSLPGVAFSVFDPNSDGFHTMEDRQVLSKPMVDAFEAGNIQMVEAFLKTSATVPIPPGWVKDHFSHGSMWDFVSKLSMPVGFFHGEIDANTPVGDVRALEARAKQAGKSNLEFHYFDGLGHGLGSTEYFSQGRLSTGYAAIVEFIGRVVR